MKKFFYFLRQRFFMLSIISVLFGVVFFLVVNSYVNPNKYYSISFKYENSVNITDEKSVTDYENLSLTKQIIQDIRKQGFESSGKYPYSDFSYVDLEGLSNKGIKLEKINGVYTIMVKIKYFNSYQQARRFMTTLISNQDITNVDAKISYLYNNELISNSSDNRIISDNKINSYDYLIYGLLSGFIVTLIFLVIIYLKFKENLIDKVVYDNETIYKYPIYPSYWSKAINIFKTPKDVILISMFFALMQVSKLLLLPSGFQNLNISFGPIFFAIICFIYGPIAGVLIGSLSDIFGFFVFPTGQPFHIGYTLNALLAGFVWGLCLYKTKVTFSKIFFARLIVNLFINGLLGSLWWSQVANLKGRAIIDYMLITSFPKNILYLIPQSIILYLVFKTIMPVFKHNGYIDDEIASNVSLF